MVKIGEYNLEGLRDSRLFYLRNPPKFITVAVLIVAVILLSATVWATFNMKSDDIQGQGIVKTIGVYNVTSDNSGTIEYLNISEGSAVEVGDVLFKFDTSRLLSERQTHMETKNYYATRLTYIDRFIDMLDTDSSGSFIDDGDEKEFYDLERSYKSELFNLTVQDQKDQIRYKYITQLYTERSQVEKDILSMKSYLVTDSTDTETINYLFTFYDNIDNIVSNDENYNPFSQSQREYYETVETFKDMVTSYKKGDQIIKFIEDYRLDLVNKINELKNTILSNSTYVSVYEKDDADIEKTTILYHAVMAYSGKESNPFTPDDHIFYLLFDHFATSFNNYDEDSDKQKESYRSEYGAQLLNQISDLEKERDSYKAYVNLDLEYKKEMASMETFVNEFDDVVSKSINPFDPSDRYHEIVNVFLKEISSYRDGSQLIQYVNEYKGKLMDRVLDLQKETASAQPYIEKLKEYNQRLAYINTMVDSLENSRADNPFTHQDSSEFYNMFESYVLEVIQINEDYQKETVRSKYMSTMLNDKNTCKQQIVSANSSISVCDSNIELCTNKAKVAGVVHLDSELHSGIYVQAGTKICSISPYADKIVEVYVSPGDRVRLDTGMHCHFTVDGLAQNEYGSVSGIVESISSDATVNDKGAMFKITISFDTTELIGKNGKAAKIMNGMTARVWTTYEEVTYLEYILQQIGIKL